MASFVAVTANAQQGRVAGQIIAAKVRGTVTALNKADNSQRTLHDNDTLSQSYVVTTGLNSSVILIFSNGSTINLSQDSTLSIDEFLQDPFDTKYTVAEAKEEPTTSTTKLTLARGELVGNVKHLHKESGSSYTVNTPVGAAGVRGTTFRIVFRPDGTGKAFFTVSTAEGEVILSGTTSGADIPIGSNKEVVVTVEVTVNAQTGVVTVTSAPPITGTTDSSAATQASIAAAVQAIVDTNTAVFKSAIEGSLDTSTSRLNDANNQSSAKSVLPDTTPGAGRTATSG